MSKVGTIQMGHKLYILDGKNPIRYVDLTKNKVHVYKPITELKSYIHKITKKHTHDYLIKDSNVRYRDIKGKEFIIDNYVCECGAGGYVKTPKELFDKGIKTLGIAEGNL